MVQHDGTHRHVAANGNCRFCLGTFRQKAAEVVDAEPHADGGHDSAHGVRRREQQPAAFRRAELYGNGHGDLRHAAALDCDFSHGAVAPGDDSLVLR